MARISKYKNINLAIWEKIIRFLLNKQYDGESIHAYFGRFKTNCETLKLVGSGSSTCFEGILDISWKELYKDYDDNTVKELVNEGKEEFKAACFILGSKNVYFGSLKKQ